MSILKALQKKQTESGVEEFNPASEKSVVVENSTVVSFDRTTRLNNTPPEVFLNNDFRIGKTNSAFNEQTDVSKGQLGR
jgi:hypothetical protein